MEMPAARSSRIILKSTFTSAADREEVGSSMISTPQIILDQVSGDLHHLLLAYSQVSHHGIGGNLMLQSF